jgi:hypothetical protein
MSFSQRSQWPLWLGKGSLMQEVKSMLVYRFVNGLPLSLLLGWPER